MTGPHATPLPLDGLLVVALEQAVTGPFCSRQLADLGARVIKVERPDGGDFARAYDGALGGLSAYFAWLNRGKESVALDLKAPAGREAMQRLVRRADVFVHNLAPGAVDRLGLGWEALAPAAPRLVWAGISGYGPDGPRRDGRAYDLLIQAEAGVVSLTGAPDAAAKVGISVADIAAGLYAFSSVLAALRLRDRTGRGTRIDIAMLECLAEWATPQLYYRMGTGREPARAGRRHSMIVPYGAYRCADGEVMFGIQNGREWARFCDVVLGQPALATDPRFAANADRVANRAALEPLIEAAFAALPAAEVLARLERGGIPNAAVNDMAGLAAHPQLAARGRWAKADSPAGPIPALLPPHNIAGVTPAMGRVPALGEHTAAVLAELGLDPPA
jgi:itaconate CoA-transferase